MRGSDLVLFILDLEIVDNTVLTEPASTGPILLLTIHWIPFQTQQNKTISHAAEACSEEKNSYLR